LFLGLDNAGKTTLLHMLKDEKLGQYEPTTHPNTEELTIGNMTFKTIDLGGHAIARRLWRTYFTEDVSGVVFIVDAADRKRFPDAKKELQDLLTTPELNSVPFLVLGNKIDKHNAVSEHQLKQYLGLEGITTGKNNFNLREDIRPLEVFMCTIVNREGFGEGLQFLSKWC